ncbi:polygalacturonase inhibitor-like [Rhodamnia argentea]|uniref:Polygalacturonase inhibitor-like n=1 Tax=Rhodamnia argentea TaxID=178133 RepID=A0ABM3HZS0_9MYRT|nr:polygalacturonase inhibitor-like [Rhodamnia argentea]
MSPARLILLLLLPLLSSFLLRPASAVLCHPEDKEVLLRIKSALNNPYLLASWNPDTDCCYWYCLKCDRKTHRVISLFFLASDLPGQFPSAISDLTYLQDLTLHKLSNFSGPIPESLTKLKYLNFLSLDWLNLTGPIPSFLGQLKNLTYLNLSFNKFTGGIPTSLSTIPGLGYVGLDRNQLTGKIPASLANLKGNNPYLILSHNGLSGELPATFAGVDFGRLDLSRNRLQGDASLLFGRSKSTSIIDISRNQFEFDLSKVEFNESLTSLDMNHNKIYGSIPKAMAGLELQFLNVSYNRLCGEIPVGGRLQSFDASVYIHNRCLCGAPLPSCK